MRIFNSNETDFSLYSNMTFKDMYEWDEFYYSSNTKHILKTKLFEVGKQELEVTEFEIKIKKRIKENYKVVAKIFGIPFVFENNETDIVDFRPAIRNIDENQDLKYKNNPSS